MSPLSMSPLSMSPLSMSPLSMSPLTLRCGTGLKRAVTWRRPYVRMPLSAAPHRSRPRPLRLLGAHRAIAAARTRGYARESPSRWRRRAHRLQATRRLQLQAL
jgi:hypothetical protein